MLFWLLISKDWLSAAANPLTELVLAELVLAEPVLAELVLAELVLAELVLAEPKGSTRYRASNSRGSSGGCDNVVLQPILLNQVFERT